MNISWQCMRSQAENSFNQCRVGINKVNLPFTNSVNFQTAWRSSCIHLIILGALSSCIISTFIKTSRDSSKILPCRFIYFCFDSSPTTKGCHQKCQQETGQRSFSLNQMNQPKGLWQSKCLRPSSSRRWLIPARTLA